MNFIEITLAIIAVITLSYIILKVILDKTFTKTEVIEFVFDAILWAEENIIGANIGKERLSYVMGKLNGYLPKYLQPIITVKVLEDFINEIFRIMKEEFEELRGEENGNL